MSSDPGFSVEPEAPSRRITIMDATYSKLRNGNWGVRVSGKAAVGDVVTARRRDNTTQRVRITHIVWSGNDVTLCEFESFDSRPRERAAAPAPKAARKSKFRPCGYPGCNPQHCDECNGEGAGSDNFYFNQGGDEADVF